MAGPATQLDPVWVPIINTPSTFFRFITAAPKDRQPEDHACSYPLPLGSEIGVVSRGRCSFGQMAPPYWVDESGKIYTPNAFPKTPPTSGNRCPGDGSKVLRQMRGIGFRGRFEGYVRKTRDGKDIEDGSDVVGSVFYHNNSCYAATLEYGFDLSFKLRLTGSKQSPEVRFYWSTDTNCGIPGLCRETNEVGSDGKASGTIVLQRTGYITIPREVVDPGKTYTYLAKCVGEQFDLEIRDGNGMVWCKSIDPNAPDVWPLGECPKTKILGNPAPVTQEKTYPVETPAGTRWLDHDDGPQGKRRGAGAADPQPGSSNVD